MKVTKEHKSQESRVLRKPQPIQCVRLVGQVAIPQIPQFLVNHQIQNHHIIPNQIIQEYVESYMNIQQTIDQLVQPFDLQWNGIALPVGNNGVPSNDLRYYRPGHGAGHLQYNNAVRQLILNNSNGNINFLFNPQFRMNVAHYIRQKIHNTTQPNLNAMANAGEI